MPISIIAVGKMAQPFISAEAEFEKRISRFDKLQVMQVPDIKEPANLSPALMNQCIHKEGNSILEKIKSQDYVIALCIEGEQLDSLQFARQIGKLRNESKHLVFIIGGSLGLSSKVVNRADAKLSLSSLTLPHQLARVVLLEQIYRSFKILSGERYHK